MADTDLSLSPPLDALPLPQSTALPFLDSASLPLPSLPIPSHVEWLTECAAYHIKSLSGQSSWTSDEEDALDDGFLLCDLRAVHTKLSLWRIMFPNVKPFFAIKCHPDPMVTALLGRTGAAGFDCASLAEIELALASVPSGRCGAHQIIYANPQRTQDALAQALKLGVRVLTFDGVEELHKVHRVYQEYIDEQSRNGTILESNVPPQMVLRILVPDEHSTIPLGEKFGAPPNQWDDLIQLAMQLDLQIIGVSFHCGSGNHDPASYVQAIHLAHEALQKIQILQTQHPAPWLLDIGGGFPGLDGCGGDENRFYGQPRIAENVNLAEGEIPENPSESQATTFQIAQAVNPVLETLTRENKALRIVAEPGRYFVEAAFGLCSRIYKKEILSTDSSSHDSVHRHYYIAHGVQGVFKDSVLCGEVFTPVPLRVAESTPILDNAMTQQDTAVLPSTVHGPSGEDYDVVCANVSLPDLEVGDWLVFDRMGAYTLSIASRSGQPPVRYVL